MVRRWSKPEMWVPGGYLALVAAMLVYVAVGSSTGDIGFFGVWPILATAPVSVLLLSTFGPAAAVPDEPAGC
ncbi:SCO4225 family membrane protein [Streptomyces sp. NPDC090112]|uniref:SCO4225 family membrane protein n=1 Tax=Streptomyces sp. NPDC090112 TaxID=3365949 RepID=UPI0038101E51